MQLILLAIAMTAVIYFVVREARKGADTKNDGAKAHLSDDCLAVIGENPLALAAILSLASLSYRKPDQALRDDICKNILEKLGNHERAENAMVTAEYFYEHIKDRLIIIDEATYYLNKLVDSTERMRLFSFIKATHQAHENTDGVSFYLTRLEKNLALPTIQ